MLHIYVCTYIYIGDQRFRTGAEAAEMLIAEAKRRDAHEHDFLQVFTQTLQTLGPVFDRVSTNLTCAVVVKPLPFSSRFLRSFSFQIPKFAFVAKEFLEPERIIQFRVSWLDDSGTYRMNRGFRVQVKKKGGDTSLQLYVIITTADAVSSYPSIIHPNQYSSALGPFEGGIHFHKECNASMLKSMAFTR